LLVSRSQLPRDATALDYQDSEEEMNMLLKWLWEVAARPILDKLGLGKALNIGDPWPRVWWITTGPLTLFPIHAAQNLVGGSSQTVLDRVVSAYIPTMKALARARKKEARLSHEQIDHMLIVAMPTTPAMNPLPGVETEVRILEQALSNSLSLSTLSFPSKSDVFSKLSGSQVVHFACHGESNVSDPSAGRLFLNDWQMTSFCVEDIVQLNNVHAQFAYLSLCHAANSSDMTLLDEGIHLAGAFHLAGFPSLVATLWQIHDTPSAEYAKTVYESLLQESGKMDISKACIGVHHAMRQLRGDLSETRKEEVNLNPLVWAPYIYIGP
jgi:CHAT domain-containing protein